MEKLKQEALNILMVAKEIQQETGSTFENAMKSIELGQRVSDTAMFSNGLQKFVEGYEKAEAQRAADVEAWNLRVVNNEETEPLTVAKLAKSKVADVAQ